MTLIFAPPTREIISDGAIAALNDGRDAGEPDHVTRDRYLSAAGVAFDAIAAPADEHSGARPDAQP